MAEPVRKTPIQDDAAESPRPQPVVPIPPGDKRAKGHIPAAEKVRDLRRRNRIRWALFALLPIVLVIAGYFYVTGGQVVSTDDAYVNAEKVGISTDVSGIVQDVDVVNNEHVTLGQVLYRLDPRQFQIAVDQAKANLAQTSLMLDSMKQDYKRMLDDVAAQKAQVDLDQVNFGRAAMLLRTGTTTQAVYDQARYTLQSAKANLEALQGQTRVQLAKLGGNADTPTNELAQYKEAQAKLAEAQRQLTDTVVKAPFSGTVTDVPATAPGRYLAASTPAFYLVDTDHVWVDADPKETQLTYVRVGQPATVIVDTYPNREWHGVVASISPAAAQEFSLLPAQNTSGNWVKVVQRIPMRVRLDVSDKTLPPLRAGMSAEVSVDTGHARGLPNFLTRWFK
jgi:membrane fusion protein, multidrug efflux system